MPFYLKARVGQLLQRFILFIVRSRWLSPQTQPNFLLAASRRSLYQTRVFRPKNVAADKVLPLVIDLHGGGFIMGQPRANDPQSRYIADHAQVIVASVDYRKAPSHPFPAAYEDTVDQISLLLRSSEIKYDGSKVFVLGTSAGGNLALGALQDPRIRREIAGVILFYPLVDVTASKEAKMATRPDSTVPDFLEADFDVIREVYLGAEADILVHDVRVSPTFFKDRKHIPEHVYVLGAEHDMLCAEAKLLAEKLAGDEKQVGDENGWQAGTVKWEHIMDQRHAFTVFGRPGETPKQKTERLQAIDTLYKNLSAWIKETAAQL